MGLFSIAAGLGAIALGSLLGGSSKPKTGSVVVQKPPEYTDFIKRYLFGNWRTYRDEDGRLSRRFEPTPYTQAILQYQNIFKEPPMVSFGGLTLPAFGLANAYARNLRNLLTLAQEAYYPLKVDTYTSPSFGQMLGGGLLGFGSALANYGLFGGK